MNSLYQQLNGQRNHSSTANPRVQQMINLLKGSKNPMQALQSLATTNPQIQSVLNLVRTSKMSPKDLFFRMAQQYGVDPNTIIDMLK